jgi:hypothetical protein
MLAKCGHFSCSRSCTARCGAGDKSVHRGQTLARGGRIARGCARLLSETKGTLQAIASCYFPVIYRSGGWENLKPAALVSRASTARPGNPGATRRIATRIHIALRAFLRWVPALVPLAQERSLHSAGTRDCRYATPERRRSWKCTTPTGLPPSTTISCVFLDDQVMRPGESLRNPDPIERDFAQMVPSSFCPARKNLFGSTASPRTRVS